jgi:hypothetical protein
MTTYYSGKNTYAVVRTIPVATMMTAHVTGIKRKLNDMWHQNVTGSRSRPCSSSALGICSQCEGVGRSFGGDGDAELRYGLVGSKLSM